MSTRDSRRNDWLQQILGTRPDSVTPASSDASFRRYFRIRHDGQSRIVMDAPPPQEDCRPFVAIACKLREAGLQVPQIFAADLEQGFLLLSDLGDAVYLGACTADNSDALYRDAIEALVQMQRDCDVADLPVYDTARLHDEMQLFVDWFWIRHLQLDYDERAREVFAKMFALLVRDARSQPQKFVHRDYHSRNLMLLPQGNPGILDFQDAVLGPVSYDLVSLLRDVYVRWPQHRIANWVAYYHAAASSSQLLDGASPETFRRWFDLIGVQRHLKIAGIFARLYYRDGKARYLSDIALTLDYLLEVAMHYRELAPLVRLIEDKDVRVRHLDRSLTCARDGTRS